MSRGAKVKFIQLTEYEKEIKKAYIEGETARDIANRYECTHTYVLRFLKELEGYENFKHKRTATSKDIVFILKNYDKLPIEKICSMLKLSKKTVLYEYNRGAGETKLHLEKERMCFIGRVWSTTKDKTACAKRIQKTSKYRTLFESNEDLLKREIQRYISTILT